MSFKEGRNFVHCYCLVYEGQVLLSNADTKPHTVKRDYLFSINEQWVSKEFVQIGKLYQEQLGLQKPALVNVLYLGHMPKEVFHEDDCAAMLSLTIKD